MGEKPDEGGNKPKSLFRSSKIGGTDFSNDFENSNRRLDMADEVEDSYFDDNYGEEDSSSSEESEEKQNLFRSVSKYQPNTKYKPSGKYEQGVDPYETHEEDHDDNSDEMKNEDHS